MIKKIREWILPKEIDFFKSLSEQSLQMLNIAEELSTFYAKSAEQDSQYILDLIAESKKNHSVCLKALNSTFITPVDRESISRAYSHLYWVGLSIKHFIIEVNTYKIYRLSEYEGVFDILQQEMSQLKDAFDGLSKKNYDATQKTVSQIIHLDNKLIGNYATHLAALFDGNDFQKIFMHKEILSQLKEISKRIHVCANLVEDIVFKMN
jgi:uncharacterized protein Yka (UPF0111/DUF47 family)